MKNFFWIALGGVAAYFLFFKKSNQIIMGQSDGWHTDPKTGQKYFLQS
jgi:hypothetical protein